MQEVSTQVNTITDRDDFLYALKQTLAFYNKDLDRMQTSFWWTACKEKPVAKLKKALIEHTKVGKFAPKPADVLTLVDSMNHHSGAISQMHTIPTTNCPKDIAKAWMWFIDRIADESPTLSGLFGSDQSISVDQQEKYLHVVNDQAHKYGMPESIPDEYKLKEVWA